MFSIFTFSTKLLSETYLSINTVHVLVGLVNINSQPLCDCENHCEWFVLTCKVGIGLKILFAKKSLY